LAKLKEVFAAKRQRKKEKIKDDPVYEELSLLTKMKTKLANKNKPGEPQQFKEISTPAKVPEVIQKDQSDLF
jgi:hypothetical protein